MGGRAVEGTRLLSEYGSKAHRGFESLPIRQSDFRGNSLRQFEREKNAFYQRHLPNGLDITPAA